MWCGLDNLGHTNTLTTVSCFILTSFGWFFSSCMMVCLRETFETSFLLKPTNYENDLQ